MNIQETIGKNVVADYFTANVKAEVIMDMLLTPVLEKVVEGTLGKTTYVTKEFPLKKIGKEYRSSNADYLLYDNRYFYLVELKTTAESETSKQRNFYQEKMENISESSKELLKQFVCLLNHVSVSGIGDKADIEESYEYIAKQLGVAATDNCYQVLNKLFERIVGTTAGADFEEKARNYLRGIGEEGQETSDEKFSSKKYIFTAAQLLQHPALFEKERTVKLIYLVPKSGKHDSDGGERIFLNEVFAQEGDEYWNWLRKIMKETIG